LKVHVNAAKDADYLTLSYIVPSEPRVDNHVVVNHCSLQGNDSLVQPQLTTYKQDVCNESALAR
jgi:hypothetical protein